MTENEIRDRIAEGYLVLDVRTPMEYEEFHVTGTLNIPLQYLSSKLHELGDISRPIVVHCAHGIRSSRAVAFLCVNGFVNVEDGGGLEAD